MLVLSRKENESTVIRVGGVEIIVKVMEIDRNKVRIGFLAPKDISILREELLTKGTNNGDAVGDKRGFASTRAAD